MQAALNVTESKGGYSFCPVTQQRVRNGREYWKFEKTFADELVPINKLASQEEAKKLCGVGNMIFRGIELEPTRIFLGVECEADKCDSVSVCASELDKTDLTVARLWVTMQGPDSANRKKTGCFLQISTENIPAFNSVKKLEIFTKNNANQDVLLHECDYKPVPPNGHASECGYGYNPIKDEFLRNGHRSFKFDKTEKGLVPIHKMGAFSGVFGVASSFWTTCDDMSVKNVQRLADRLVIDMSCTIGEGEYITVSGADLKRKDQDMITLWLGMSGYEKNKKKEDFKLNVSTANIPAFETAKKVVLKTMHKGQEVTLAQVDLHPYVSTLLL